MAEASASGTGRSVLCRYFANGVCRFGQNCHNSHDREGSAADNVCRYYLAGNCGFGARCRYEHARPREDRSQPQSSPQPSASFLEAHPSGARAKQQHQHQQQQQQQPPYQQQHQKRSNSALNRFAKEYKPSESKAESYKEALSGLKDLKVSNDNNNNNKNKKGAELCPFTAQGECPYQEACQYIHGDVCELCGKPCLHPFDEEQRKAHQAECMKVLEDDMRLSFAISRSSDKICGICMEGVMEKSEEKDRRFGILTGCNHIFCLNCIREWRGRKEFKHDVVRACPECRLHSDFIVPSSYWFEDEKEKDEFISGYKSRLSKKACKYFNKGRGKCPFGSACFYLHAFEDGTIATNEEPPRPKQRRVRTANNTVRAIQESLLWDFLEERENRGAFSSVIDLDEDFIFQLLRSVGEAESDDDTYSEVSDEYFDSDWTDDDDDYANMRLLLS